MSVQSPDHSDSSLNNDDAYLEVVEPLNENVPCKICRLQMSTVTYFNVPVCSGCRAFFRRSVKNGKKYHCLNSRLCGKQQLVPNRRVCKYCRFNRCVKAGMLDAKVKLQSRILESVKVQINDPTSSSPSPPDEVFGFEEKSLTVLNIENNSLPPNHVVSYVPPEPSTLSSNVLVQFNRLRRRIIFEKSKVYGRGLQVSKGVLHDMQVGLNEHTIFNQIVSSTDNLFNEIDVEDWDALNTQEYSMLWSILEQTLANVRNQGFENRRIYNSDGTFSPMNIDHIRQHWSAIYSCIFGNRDAIFDAIMNYAFQVQLLMCSTVATQLASAHLDETEISALMLLLMTRPTCFDAISKRSTHQFLYRLRNNTLQSLASYIEGSGRRDVDERMAQIIFLITGFQNLSRLISHSMRLLVTATDYRAIPDQIYKMIEQQPPQLHDIIPFRTLTA